MNRRGFLQSCLALGAAPAIVKADSLMKIWTPPQEIITWQQPIGSLQPEILIYDRALSVEEQNQVMNYLLRKHAR